MRLINRPLAFLLAAALGFAAVMVIVEVIAFALDAKPVLLDWPTWHAWAGRTRWDRTVVRVWSIVLIALGGVLLLLELKPARSRRVKLDSDDPATDAAMTRKGLAGAARGAAENIDGISHAAVTSTGRTVTVTARAVAGSKAAAEALQAPVTDAVTTKLDTLGLSRAPRIRVTVTPKKP